MSVYLIYSTKLRCASPAGISSHAVNFSGLILDSRLTRIVKSIARYSPGLVCLCGPSSISKTQTSAKKTISRRSVITTDQKTTTMLQSSSKFEATRENHLGSAAWSLRYLSR